MMSTYDPHAVIVVYSIIDRASFIEAETILNYFWKMSYNETKGIILVANKIDLERSRVISHDGKLSKLSIENFLMTQHLAQILITSGSNKLKYFMKYWSAIDFYSIAVMVSKCCHGVGA